MDWMILFAAGAFEIGFTTCLQLSNNFTDWRWTLGFVLTSITSFYLLNMAAQTIPMGTAYAVWTGIGAVGTVLIGIFFFKEPHNFWRIIFLFTLIASIIGLKFVSAK